MCVHVLWLCMSVQECALPTGMLCLPMCMCVWGGIHVGRLCVHVYVIIGMSVYVSMYGCECSCVPVCVWLHLYVCIHMWWEMSVCPCATCMTVCSCVSLNTVSVCSNMHVSWCVQAYVVCAVFSYVCVWMWMPVCAFGMRPLCSCVCVHVCACVRRCGTLGDLKAVFGKGRAIRKPQDVLDIQGQGFSVQFGLISSDPKVHGL